MTVIDFEPFPFPHNRTFQLFVFHKLTAVVCGNALYLMAEIRDGLFQAVNGLTDCAGFAVFQLYNDFFPSYPFRHSQKTWSCSRTAHDQVHFPVSALTAAVDFFRPLFNARKVFSSFTAFSSVFLPQVRVAQILEQALFYVVIQRRYADVNCESFIFRRLKRCRWRKPFASVCAAVLLNPQHPCLQKLCQGTVTGEFHRAAFLPALRPLIFLPSGRRVALSVRSRNTSTPDFIVNTLT